MARPIKQGIDYFPFDVNFFADTKIRKISRACGAQSISILICLLCNIYKEEGYYITWDDDLPFVIADTVGVSEGAVREVVTKSLQVGLFDTSLYDRCHILTSTGIQKRFRLATYQRKGASILAGYLVSCANNPVSCANNPVSCARSTQSKVKEKENAATADTRTRDDEAAAAKLFVETWNSSGLSPLSALSAAELGQLRTIQGLYDSALILSAVRFAGKTPSLNGKSRSKFRVMFSWFSHPENLKTIIDQMSSNVTVTDKEDAARRYEEREALERDKQKQHEREMKHAWERYTQSCTNEGRTPAWEDFNNNLKKYIHE